LTIVGNEKENWRELRVLSKEEYLPLYGLGSQKRGEGFFLETSLSMGH